MGNPLIFSYLCSLQALSVTSGTLKRQLIHFKQSQKHCSSHFKIKIILHGHHQTYKSWTSTKKPWKHITLPCRHTSVSMYFLILLVPSTHSRGQRRSHISLPELPGSDQTLGGFVWQTNHGRRELLRKKKTQSPAKSQSLATWNNLHSIWGVVLNYDDLFLKVPGPSLISSLKPRVPPWLNCESTSNLDVHVNTLFQHISRVLDDR